MYRLECKVQNYEWGKLGSSSKVAQLKNSNIDETRNYAELWMGTHPNAPSTILHQQKEIKLSQFLNSKVLHPSIAQLYNNDLPFLFKILSIAKALSIQAHPDKKLAEKLHATRPDMYKDGNHKPEMAIALTPFEGLCGFRPLEEISKFLTAYPEFTKVVTPEIASEFQKVVSNAQSSIQAKKAALKKLFKALMEADDALIKTQVVSLVASFRKEEVAKIGSVSELVSRLNRQFPGDVGCFCVLLLNYMSLKPGEAFFMGPNEPHAYLSGDCVECMATSDNVVRAGCTPKVKDVDTLVGMLNFNFGPASLLASTPYIYKGTATTHSKIFNPPVPEFSLMETAIKANEKASFEGIRGPSLIIIVKGSANVNILQDASDKKSIAVEMGNVFFIAANTELEFCASKDLQMYRAYCVV